MLLKLNEASHDAGGPHGRNPPTSWFDWRWLAWFGVGAVITSFGALALGTPLGTAMWALVVGMILSLSATDDDATSSSLRVDMTAIGVALPVLLVPTVFSDLPRLDTLLSTAVVYFFVNATSGAMRLLIVCKLNQHAARGVVLVAAMLWLAWPVVFANVLVGQNYEATVDWLVSLHPPFALNMLLEPGDPWSHRPLAYRLMRLGQDINYAMPTTSLWCIIAHLPLLLVNWSCAMRGASTFFAKRGIIDPM